MPRKHDYAKVRNAVGALDFAGVAVKEITRRLNDDEAGVGYPVNISQRQTYYYRTAYRAEHGDPRQVRTDQTADSMQALRDRSVALIQREIAELERQPAGSLTTAQSRTLREHFRTLAEMERRENANLGKARSHRETSGEDEPDRPETTAQRLAREETEEEDVATVGNGH